MALGQQYGEIEPVDLVRPLGGVQRLPRLSDQLLDGVSIDVRVGWIHVGVAAILVQDRYAFQAMVDRAEQSGFPLFNILLARNRPFECGYPPTELKLADDLLAQDLEGSDLVRSQVFRLSVDHTKRAHCVAFPAGEGHAGVEPNVRISCD